jgi:hypothetical protein
VCAVERTGADGNWLKVDVEMLGAKYLPITKGGEILFESVTQDVSVPPRLPSEGSRTTLRDRVMSVGSSIGALRVHAAVANGGGGGGWWWWCWQALTALREN